VGFHAVDHDLVDQIKDELQEFGFQVVQQRQNLMPEPQVLLTSFLGADTGHSS